jgi:hypothetical protein
MAGADDPGSSKRNTIYTNHLLRSREYRSWIAASKRQPAGGNPNFQKSLAAWFDRTRYVVPDIYTYGQVRANTLRAGSYKQFDASIFKNFSLPGESVLSFRAEFFNFPNTVSFNAPSNVTIDNAAAGQVTSSSNSPRSIQFALKYNF